MFWTALLWGIGTSLGAAFGLIVFFLMFHALQLATGRAERIKDIREVNQQSIDALKERNELTKMMITHLASIATCQQDFLKQKSQAKENHELEDSTAKPE